jgi:hypothetical protein
MRARVRWSRRLIGTAIAVVLFVACSGGKGSTDANASGSGGTPIGGSADDTGPLAWPLPPADQVAPLAQGAGLQLERRETLIHHVHAHLDVFVNGEHRTVPAGIGIVITDPAVHSGTVDGQPAYGGIAGCDQPCISPLHTHDVTGVLHTESATDTDNTLGQFFKEWNQKLDASCVGEFCTPATAIAIYVNGKSTPLAGAADIRLTDHEEIAIVIGTPPARIPSTADFTKA